MSASSFPTPVPVPAAWQSALRLRVRYSECDPMRVVYHGSYIPWLEEARTHLLRMRGKSYAALEAQGVLLVIVKLDVAYRASARYDDIVEVRCRVKASSRVKIEHEYEIVITEQGDHGPSGVTRVGQTCVVARTVLACVDRTGRVRELPPEISEFPAANTQM